MKGVRIWNYFGPHFPLFGLNNSEYRRFLHSVLASTINKIIIGYPCALTGFISRMRLSKTELIF